MSLDGLRAWIGLVERKLTMRTRVFLVLVAIAIGAAGTGIYLAIDARDDAVSESDLQTVRDELAGEAGVPGGESVAGLEAQIEALQAEVAELKEEAGSGTNQPGADSTTPGGSDGGTGTPGSGEESGAEGTSGGATLPKTQAQLKALVEKAQEGTNERK
jgi:hypothetical protein